MKKVLILILLFFSCEKTYEYIEVVRVEKGLTEKKKELKSKNDSTAYFEGYMKFYISKKYYEKNKKEYGAKESFDFYYDEPIRFKLINKEGDNLTLNPDYKDIEKSEQLIRKIVDGMSHLQ